MHGYRVHMPHACYLRTCIARDMAKNRKNMDNSDYSLKWNNFTSNLTCGFLSHLSDHELVDVTLAVEGKLLQAHKLVLSVCSPYFKEIFKANPCTHPVVVLKDMGYSQVEALLKFMYKGEVNVSHNELASFLKIAEALKIKGLAGDQNSHSDSPIESDTPLPPSELIEEVDFDVATCSNPNTGETCSETLDGNRPVKRLRESTRSRSLTPKRNRTSPPALKEMEYLKESPHSIKAKSEPEDFDVTDEPYFLDQPLEQFLNSQNDAEKGFLDGGGGELTDQPSMNSPMPSACSQGGEGVQVVEPVTYRLSARGRPQLVYEGYVYNLTSRSEVLNRSHYRCAEQHRGCRGKCAVIAERFMPTGVRNHNHPPGYQSEYHYRKKKGLDTDII
ncbi:zinc finger and BTB domain-containing protein 41 isoform X2 [Neodiprion pinetum]|uniref:Uncharacterized protein LOC107222593 isoform X2 n=1 Tax=Neodiprion lecontei TaxID=441921 RepID=A0A6J0BT66_NEOLC|nr:uncharacterized protein LOC107222593 isoform X2 [Neodiprion lecontei]XP_046467439.1 uncharacterized protein LOC124211936 isoform X2 [Neodiprion pinetum]